MRFTKYITSIFIILMLASCGRDEALGPIITVDKAEIGAFPRLVQLITGEYDLENVSSSAYSHEVEFQSEDAGQNVTNYTVFVQFEDANPDNGDDSKAEMQFVNYSQSDFGDSELGLRNITVNYPFTEVAAALGVDIANVLPGDQFRFRSLIALADGREFSQDNTESTILSSAFRGYFNWTVKATCPLADDIFAGDYILNTPDGAGLGYGPGYEDGIAVTITPVSGSSTLREFSSIVLPGIGGFGPYTTRFDIVCDKAILVLMDSGGLGCGGGGIQFGPAVDVDGNDITAPLDLGDDSEITFFMNEGFSSGGCPGQTGETATRVVLTKK